MTLVGVCGGRDYQNAARVNQTLSALDERISGPIAIITGGARGADALAEEWAWGRGIAVVVVPANWDAHGKWAGPKRNMVIAELGLRYLVAFPGGTGTADMVSRCRGRGDVEIIEVAP